MNTEKCVDHRADVGKRVVPALQAAMGDQLKSVVLFGSRARGDHTQYSDWDLFIIADELPKGPLERHQRLKCMVPAGIRGAAAIFAVTRREFEAHLPEVYLDIALDGRIIHDTEGYAAEKLAQLRRIIDKSGLYRESSGKGHVWKWRTEPKQPWSITWEE